MLKLAMRINRTGKCGSLSYFVRERVAAAGALYLYFHNPYSYPLPCIFYTVTGLYCPDAEQEEPVIRCFI